MTGRESPAGGRLSPGGRRGRPVVLGAPGVYTRLMSAAETVRTDRDGAILRVTLDRSEKRNALDRAMLQRLGEILEDAAADRDVRALVLAGEGPAFSAGVDLGMLAGDVGGEESRPFRRTVAGMQAALTLVERIEKPVVVALHGHVLGLALELALACDIRIAARDTRLGLPEVKLGLVPDVGGTTRLTRVVGPARAKELILTGRMIDADQAAAIGLVNEVVELGTHVERALGVAREIAANAPQAVGLGKRLVDLATEMDKHTSLDVEVLVQSVLKNTEDAVEGPAALRERRPPNFRGR